MPIRLAVAVLVFVFICLSGLDKARAQSPSPSSLCAHNVTRYNIISDAETQSARTTYSNVRSARLTVSVPEEGCLIVTLTGEMSASADSSLFFKVLLDGDDTRCLPAEILAVGLMEGVQNKSLTFFCRNLSNPKPTISVQMRKEGAGPASIGDRVLTIQYYVRIPDNPPPVD